MSHTPVPLSTYLPSGRCDHPAHARCVRADASAFPLVRVRPADGPSRALVDEWNTLATRPAVLALVNSWRLVPDEFVHLDELLVAAGFGRAVDDNDGDHILWHLASLARVETVAARAVLQRVLPALISTARRRGRVQPGGTGAAIDEILASAWETVRTYPAERRPAKVAANIVLDSQYRAFVAPVRRKRVEEVSAELVNSSRWTETELGLPADLEIAVVLEVAESRGVDPGLVALLRRFAAGETSEDIARGSGWSSRTIRNRRAEALEAVRRVLDDGVSE